MKRKSIWIVLVAVCLVAALALGLGLSRRESVNDAQPSAQTVEENAAPVTPAPSLNPEPVSAEETGEESEEEFVIPEEWGDDYSEVVEDYVVELQEDEVIDFG